MTQAGDEAGGDDFACGKNDRNRRSRRLGGLRPSAASGRKDDRHLTPDKIGRQTGQSIVVTLRPPKLDRDVLALDVAGFVQTLAERSNKRGPLCERCTAEKTDHWHH